MWYVLAIPNSLLTLGLCERSIRLAGGIRTEYHLTARVTSNLGQPSQRAFFIYDEYQALRTAYKAENFDEVPQMSV